jgi:hypothetical protein
MSPEPPDRQPPSVAEQMAQTFFGAGSDPASIRRAIRRWLIAAGYAAVLTPLIFWLRFGEVGALGWGLTVFLTVYCLLTAVGLYYLRRPEYHTPVAVRGDWRDRVGAFWLVSCAFGPFLGWVLTSATPLTVENWRWLYAGRAFFSVILPLITALPLLRYVRGKGTLVMLALLIGVTALPIWSCWDICRDLVSSPVTAERTAHLPYTGEVLH